MKIKLRIGKNPPLKANFLFFVQIHRSAIGIVLWRKKRVMNNEEMSNLWISVNSHG